jgi:Cu(I)/Ag(I) efflux system membrane protein CusA/SilA
MIGGMISSAALTLIVIPAVYGIVKGWRLPKQASVGEPMAADQLKLAAE